MAASRLCAVLAFQGAVTSGAPEERPPADRRVAGRWAVASGLLAGLALLTKGPAILLFPMVPLLALSSWWQAPCRWSSWRTPAVALIWWGLGVAAAMAVWPAMWVDPAGTLRRTAEFVRNTGSTPHAPGSFFLGQPVSD